ncbi:hypothetical protein HID58_050139 [Brassica napus]|uniref:EF-hand domain-containing protein n=2 Tax=Brassica TaxID=3705 RepID=A0A8X8BH88_BRACI|nr:probable calcium-binding protein CML32 [Brassica napus]KAG2334598.1 hypothetical protein Bca52824_005778 [Brassica carinata]KAH0887710.1 hypothetical protein HID58_050139 [Brassica napus]CAF1696299.1 unnamed protein product [Brassica napus]
MSYVKVFESIDKNKDGKISWDEFSQWIRAFSPLMTSEEIDEMFTELDADGDRQIDIVEFAKCYVVGEKEEEEEEAVLKEAFDLYDINRDGKISPGELHVVLKRLGRNKSMEECASMVGAVDADQDGHVSFEEFKTMMNSDKKLL